jgi:UDP-GlcNAc3NAcA epimerase
MSSATSLAVTVERNPDPRRSGGLSARPCERPSTISVDSIDYSDVIVEPAQAVDLVEDRHGLALLIGRSPEALGPKLRCFGYDAAHVARPLIIATVVGARPQFVKAAVVSRAIARRGGADNAPGLEERLIHTGQHFDDDMSRVFFRQMEIPAPDHHLGIHGGGHGAMTGRMLEAIERVLLDIEPDWVLVYGDTNSTLAGALAAAKLHLPAAHVEAGLRSFNRRMPEETNRVVADHVCDVLFAPTAAAVANLRREGIPAERVCRVGDVMYDAMLHYRARIGDGRDVLGGFGLEPGRYVLATVHRAENTDDDRRLRGIVEGLALIGRSMPVLLPLHPRTRLALEREGLLDACGAGVRLVGPVGYFQMLALEANAAVIATDSGGVQKEAYFNRVPCLTLRDETEWVELVETGANQLVGSEAQRILEGYGRARSVTIDAPSLHGFGDAAERIIDRLMASAALQRGGAVAGCPP